ncbi:protein phosphatase 2C domain-containing protein [Paraburkholderia fungorum]|uniref:PP2C family protein-serine/threonine phosphatase n=1 Tax=Paraburkholderia fungorum TaxID=134537 RepID=UPI0038BAAC68
MKPSSPNQTYQLATGCAFGLSDIGLVRRNNEDNFLIDDALGLAIVCDGMGGHDAGEVASTEALALFHQFIAEVDPHAFHHEPHDDPDATLPGRYSAKSDGTAPQRTHPAITVATRAVEHVNEQLYAMNRSDMRPDGRGMGTTMTGIWRQPQSATMVVFHVGDSRLYRWRDSRMLQITSDQTLYQKALDAGITVNLPGRNELLQAIGPSPLVEPEVHRLTPRPGDLYLLCSDGLHGMLNDQQIADVLRLTTPDTLATCSHQLVELAKQHGGKDNVTVVLVWFDA